MSNFGWRRLAIVAAFPLTATATVAQRPDTALPPAFRQPMQLYTVGLGKYSWPITTKSREAQAFFDQGVQLLYSFTPEDAARSFREAQKRDPGCAMCYFAEAWAWGPYLNGPMPARNAPRAHAAAQQAQKLVGSTSAIEQALITTMAVRYQPVYDSACMPTRWPGCRRVSRMISTSPRCTPKH
jgi:hypothetical protein